jgi:hypothetical protein
MSTIAAAGRGAAPGPAVALLADGSVAASVGAADSCQIAHATWQGAVR